MQTDEGRTLLTSNSSPAVGSPDAGAAGVQFSGDAMATPPTGPPFTDAARAKAYATRSQSRESDVRYFLCGEACVDGGHPRSSVAWCGLVCFRSGPAFRCGHWHGVWTVVATHGGSGITPMLAVWDVECL